MKTKFMLRISIFILSSIIIFLSCKKETSDKSQNGIYLAPVSSSSVTDNLTLLFASVPYKFPLSAAILSPVSTNVDVTIAVDNDMVAAYNTAQKTSYLVMPEGSYSLEATNLTIPEDGIASNQTNIFIKSNLLTADVTYLLPVKVVSVSSSDITLNPAFATKYYIVRSPTPIIANLTDGKASYWKNPSASLR